MIKHKIVFVLFFSLFLFPNLAFADTPQIPTALRSDKKSVPVAGFNAGDTITVVFSEPTNEPLKKETNNNLSKAQVDSLFLFSNSIGTDYTGKWLDPLLFEITIQNSGGVNPDDPLTLVITAKAAGGIRDAALSSAASTASPIFYLGSFDTHAGPAAIGLIADDPNGGDNVYSTGDTITVRFSESTNEPLKGLNNDIAKADVNKLFSFNQNLGTGYSGTWKNPSTFVITIDDATGASPPTVGLLNVTIFASLNAISLKNADETSAVSGLFAFANLTGNFGGFEESIQLGAGGRAISRLPSGTLGIFEPPSTIADTITITRTAAPTTVSSGNATFVGDVIEIESTSATTCSDICKFTFSVSEDDLAEVDVESSSLRLLHDRNDDGDFNDVGEVLSTELLSGSLTGTFLVNATDDRISKFAVGGVRALATAGITSSIASTLGLIDPNKCDPDGFASGVSLRVYQIEYDKCELNKIEILAHSTCGPISAQIVSKYGTNLAGMSSTQPFLQDKKEIYSSDLDSDLESVNVVIKDKRDKFSEKLYLNQCNDKKEYRSTTGYTSQQQGSPIESDTTENTTTEQIDQLESQIPSWIKNNAKWWSSGQITDSEFSQGIEYLIKQDIVDVPESAKTEIQEASKQIPSWVKTNSQWWSEGKITDSEFTKGLEYLIKMGVIRV